VNARSRATEAAPRRARTVFLALVLAAPLAGCETEPEPWDSLRVVVDTNATVPDELDGFTVTVTREGVALFDETYGEDVAAALPDSLVLVNEHPNNDSPEKQLETVKPISITVTGWLEDAARVSRSASLRFNRGTYQLPLPLCRACFDKPPCEPGATCKHGKCEDEWIGATGELPADDGELATEDCGN